MESMQNRIQMSLNEINKIHEVKGFDPNAFAVEYADRESGEIRKRIPVVVLIAWFRMVYPEGKITLDSRETSNGTCISTARIYPKYTDTGDSFLAEASASRIPVADRPYLTPRECAQTAAIGIALRNAGFGLQFNLVSEDIMQGAESTSETQNITHESKNTDNCTDENPCSDYDKAIRMPCPIKEYKDKTMGEVLKIDSAAIRWISERYSKDETIKEAARIICEHALAE